MPLHRPPAWFRRIDETDDIFFYDMARKVVHIDEWAIRNIGEIFAQHLPRSARLLDLMSSWRSHLPSELHPATVVGLGLNQAEMDDNPSLTEVVVHDLNRNPRLPFADSSFDGVVLTVSVQYLIHPVEVFGEVGRVLRDHARFIVAFSNRMFPTKAVEIWRESSEPRRVELVRDYLADSGAFEHIETATRIGDGEAFTHHDPVYAVIGRRRGRD